jgi:hypothetical protein
MGSVVVTRTSAKGEAVAAMLTAADSLRSEARHLNDKARQLKQAAKALEESLLTRLDHAIISGEGSGSIYKRLGVNSTTVRRRRSILRECGHIIKVRYPTGSDDN